MGAAIPSSGSFVATHDHYRCRLGATCSNSSCSPAQCPGEAIPRPPVSAVLLPFVPGDCRGSGLQQPDLTLLLSDLPKADPGHWWASFFFGKPTLPLLAMVLEITCDLAQEVVGQQQPGSQPGTPNCRPPS
uniref:Pancreatic progenitor cell differentiation and proliferation factor n=1 Tax=Sus scrofa TaxID=9823 RepID=A0A8D1KMV9_PIG